MAVAPAAAVAAEEMVESEGEILNRSPLIDQNQRKSEVRVFVVVVVCGSSPGC